jgi:hypothetical protein
MVQLASRWDALVWPRWLPVSARMPLVAQITGVVALTALVMGPWWARVPELEPVQARPLVPHPVPVQPVVAPHSPTAHRASARPAHLNLDVRHAFSSVDLTVTVDGTMALDTTLPGSGKRFKVFGKRAERGHTRTLDLVPGARLVRVRVRSTDNKFDQTRVERFELGAAAVASMTITAEKSGLTLVTERPPAPPPPPAAAATSAAPATASAPPPVAVTLAPPAPPVEATSAWSVELLYSLRSMLIAIAGFVASAATGFIVQEFLRTRRRLFAESEAEAGSPKRRRAGFAG